MKTSQEVLLELLETNSQMFGDRHNLSISDAFKLYLQGKKQYREYEAAKLREQDQAWMRRKEQDV